MKLDQFGEKNPYWKGGKVQLKCLECGKLFDAHPADVRRGRKFCSTECGYENKRRRVKFICEICGKEVERRKNEYDKNEHNLCSYKCAGIWTSENLVGENNHNYGRKFTYEHRKKMGDATRGEKHYRWKGGIKSENQKIRNQMDYKDWRTVVFERDNYTCQLCGQRGGHLQAHHILSFAGYPEYRFEVDNGITECKECHFILYNIEKAGDMFQPLPAYV